MWLMTGRAIESVWAEHLVRMGNFLKMALFSVASVAGPRLIDRHRKSFTRVWIVTIGAPNAGQVVRSALPLVDVRPRVALKAQIFARFRLDLTMGRVAGQAVKRAAVCFQAESGAMRWRVGGSQTMRVMNRLEPLHLVVTAVTNGRGNGRQIVRCSSQ